METKIKIKEQIVLCKAYINEIMLGIDIDKYGYSHIRFDRVELFLEDFLQQLVDLTKLIDEEATQHLNSKEIILILNKIIEIKNYDELEILLEQKLLVELRYIENLLGLAISPKAENLLSQRYDNDGTSSLGTSDYSKKLISQIVQKINSNEYKTEYVKCNCGADDYTIISKKEKYGINLQTVICKQCGLVYLNPRFDRETYNDFYEKYFLELDLKYAVRKRLIKDLEVNEEEFQKLFIKDYFERNLGRSEIIKKYCYDLIKDRKLNILEIGCGTGGNIQGFKNEGHQVMGIDIGSDYLEHAKEIDLDLRDGFSSELLKEYKNSFDLILMVHVVEHFTDIDKELEVARQLLKPDGYLYIEVPGVKSPMEFGFNYDILKSIMVAHTHYFTLSTLTNILNKNKFELVKGNEYISSLFKVNENITPSVSEIDNYTETLEYMKMIENYFRNMYVFK